MLLITLFTITCRINSVQHFIKRGRFGIQLHIIDEPGNISLMAWHIRKFGQFVEK